jgi:hypothetical protein
VIFAEPDAYERQEHRDTDEGFAYVSSRVYKPGAEIDAMLSEAASADVASA